MPGLPPCVSKMSKIAWVGIVLAVQSTAVLGDDYKEATEAAYCIGVYQSDIEGERRRYIDPKNANTHDTEMRQFKKQAFVEGAIKRRIIDEVTVSKMKAVGYADGNSCWQQMERCTKQWHERSEQKMDDERNNRMLENCNKLAESVCERARSGPHRAHGEKCAVGLITGRYRARLQRPSGGGSARGTTRVPAPKFDRRRE